MAQQSSLIGVIVTGQSGKYRITDEVNSGAQAMVYKGLDLANNKPVAIKILLSTDAGAPERAEREARILQKLRPHNIMFVRDFGNYNDRGLIRFFCVLPYFPGGITLDDIIGREGAIQPLARALDLLSQIANGLKEAHASGVVHRDIKPANVMVHKDAAGHETAYITDFGTAAVDDDLAEAFERKLTLEDRMLGTPHYMSPQQLVGAGSNPDQEKSRKDPRNDVYSFGVTAYEMLTGASPFPYDGNDLAEFTYKKRIGKLRPDSLGKAHPELPTELVMLVDRCMAFELEDRPRSADVLSELNIIKLDQPPSQPDTPRTLGRVKTPGSTRVSGDAETIFAPSSPPPALTSDPKVVAVKPKTGGLHSRARTMLILMAVVASAIVGWALLSERTKAITGPMDSGSAMAMPAVASASAKELAAVSVSASASAKPKPKAKPLPGKPRVDWSPPATGEQPLDPGLPGPPM